jgi:thioredoxin reductase
VNVDVLVVGAGPAGLAAAIELRRLGVRRVIVADREARPGGVPRHCAHTGYGLRDLHRVMTGPAYARHYAGAAAAAGADIRCGATVTAISGPPWTASLTSPAGLEAVNAGAVLLATGCRERPRAARLVPGDRPAGVLTTGELQQRVYLFGERLAGPALVIGAEHVSFSAMLTLAHAGASVTALVTEQPRHQSYPAFAIAAALAWRVPVVTSTRVARVVGGDRLTAVDLRNLTTSATRRVPCETLVFSGDWIPDHELARLAGTSIDPASSGPAVDTASRTSVAGLFAAGNLVHAGETADVAALAGRHAARHIAAAVRGDADGAAPVPLGVRPPLSWIAPSRIAGDLTAPPRGTFVLHGTEFRRRARLDIRQDGKLLARTAVRLVPGRGVRLGADWVALVDPGGGPVQVSVS